MTKYRELLYDFFKEEINKQYAAFILRKLLQANKPRKGKYPIKIGRETKYFSPEEVEKRPQEICDAIVEKALKEGYNALAIPSLVSVNLAPNFYIFKEEPKEEEIWWWLYHILTGVFFGDNVLNLVNIPEETREGFREYLINENLLITGHSSNIRSIQKIFHIPMGSSELNEYEFISGFLFLSTFVKFWMGQKRKEVTARDFEIEFNKKVTEDTTLLIFSLSREKKKVYFFPKLNSLISKWFSDVLSSNEKEVQITPLISSFLFSFYIRDTKYKKITGSLLNKFLYYFLSGHIKGDILSALVTVKATYELGKKKGKIAGVYGRSAEFFFSNL
jgi:hypothetical protein